MAAESIASRRSARVFLLDARGRVLLIRFVVQRGGGQFAFWATPGGEIEGQESPCDAAARELQEELGLSVPLSGPVYEAHNMFEIAGRQVQNTDFFFLGRCETDAPKLAGVTGAEISAMREVRWWSANEIKDAPETIFPIGLADIVRTLI
jgi:8-oxo-dGTP pyrophosphatase MutT (NUDIX family)